VAQPLPRLHRDHERVEDERKLARILLETGEPAPTHVGHATSGGDEKRLRGLPAIGRNVRGVVAGTDPLLAKERRRR
jgi:hypothetical protein